MPLATTWDLTPLFNEERLTSSLKNLQQDINQLQQNLQGQIDWPALIDFIQKIDLDIRQASSYIHCLGAQNIHDEKAKQLEDQIKNLDSLFQTNVTLFEQKLAQLSEDEFNTLLQHESLAALSFPLRERRTLAKDKLDFSQEALIQSLTVDGYHGWSQMYDTCVGQMSVRCKMDNEEKLLSIGQASNYLSDPDQATRQEVFTQWEKAWNAQRDLFAQILNHLAGFRLRVYQSRGWNSVLKEPLQLNRMSEETLHTMWRAVEENLDPFIDFLQLKAKIIGVDQLSWHDVAAPLYQAQTKISYDEGAQIILEHFEQFSPEMAACARLSFEQRWNEVEDRPGKRPGGFRTSFPLSHQSRIFMTYSGSQENLTTLAHELGHAYHQFVMDDLPALAQNYPMNLAETASTFAEQIISEALLQKANAKEERLALLADRIQRAIIFFMNIRSRFLFELAFYEERRTGLVSAERLSQLMEQAQQKAFGHTLKEYHPHFWASKLHFYITDMPFYNFPYTFGYLFSLGLFAWGRTQSDQFANHYRELLRDTGRMTAEELAQNHLGVDLKQASFWQQAVDVVKKDVEDFKTLVESKN